MEICEKGEVFIEENGDWAFDHTNVILRGPYDEYFYAKTDQRIFRSPKVDIHGLDIIRIPADHIWPVADPKFTRAPDPLPADSYYKRASLLNYGNTPNNIDYSHQILTEVEACEILKMYPHPNIAQYLGCVVKGGRIIGLGFSKYTVTLSQMLEDGTPFDRSHCLRGIEAGLTHMHKLGLVHNDLNPSNIMMDGGDFVIIDFDSCQREGEKLVLKEGSDEWTLDGENYARRDNDLYSLSKIRIALM